MKSENLALTELRDLTGNFPENEHKHTCRIRSECCHNQCHIWNFDTKSCSDNPEHSTPQVSSHNQEVSKDVSQTGEYDRYPYVAGLRGLSTTSLLNKVYQKQKNNLEEAVMVSNLSSDKSAENIAETNPLDGFSISHFLLHIEGKESDDYLHNPDPIKDAQYDKQRFLHDLKWIDKRVKGGIVGISGLFLVSIVVFILLPAFTYSLMCTYNVQSYTRLSHYKYPLLSAIRTNLIDSDTPLEALTRKGSDHNYWKLVFSDEFNAEGRTFYEGDDQFFAAIDLNYASTQDLEWYDPDAVTTKRGCLNIRLDAYKNHDLFYRSGMVQSWNKLCFTQGILEVSVRMPSYYNITGLWPGVWTLGNLGRAGYMASNEGIWPYSYSSCDAGIAPNQSSLDGISYLPGQRLNKCTCPGEAHPNPGTGRGAPEIDVFEAEHGGIDNGGLVSQSLQIAPFDIWYYPDYNFFEIYNVSITAVNPYTGGPFQQCVSTVTTLNEDWYEKGGKNRFQSYGFEYMNDRDTGYISWYVGKEATSTIRSYGLGPNGNIDWRYISKEPMSIIMNLGISNSWSYINWPGIDFPANMDIDYIRIYQPEDAIDLTCDPPNYPTTKYIQDHLNLYENENLTLFEDGGYRIPKNQLTGC